MLKAVPFIVTAILHIILNTLTSQKTTARTSVVLHYSVELSVALSHITTRILSKLVTAGDVSFIAGLSIGLIQPINILEGRTHSLPTCILTFRKKIGFQ